MSCSFWNMRRRAAQKAKEKAIVPETETVNTTTETVVEKPEKKAVKANGTNKRTNK